jgi:methylated-DNA-protein-cysteine methyltransferase-like protein
MRRREAADGPLATVRRRKQKTDSSPKRTPIVEMELANAQRILVAVMRIPRGRVSTYGNIADVAGLPRRARLVGTVLRQTPTSTRVPWFRVINAGGKISFAVGSDAYERQRSHLESEGISLIRGRVDLNRYGWPSRETELDELLWKVE